MLTPFEFSVPTKIIFGVGEGSERMEAPGAPGGALLRA